MSAVEALAVIAARNHGVLTRSEILRAQVNLHRFRTLVELGVLVRITRGIYCLAGAPNTWEHRLAIAATRLGPTSVVSHRSAAALWELDRYRPGPIDIATPWPSPRSIKRAPLPFRVTHRALTDLGASQVTTHKGFRVTTPERTLVDMGPFVGAHRLGSMIDDAVRRQLTTFQKVIDCTDELRRQGKTGLARPREAMSSRDVQSRVSGSAFEEEVREFLIEARLPEPVRQFCVNCGEDVFSIDLAWPELLIGIECDGFRYHSLPSDLEADDRRNNELQLAGWIIFRISWNMLHNDRDGTAQNLRRVLHARGWEPNDPVSRPSVR